MRISDWSSDVCSSDLLGAVLHHQDCGVARVDRSRLAGPHLDALPVGARTRQVEPHGGAVADLAVDLHVAAGLLGKAVDHAEAEAGAVALALGGEEDRKSTRLNYSH